MCLGKQLCVRACVVGVHLCNLKKSIMLYFSFILRVLGMFQIFSSFLALAQKVRMKLMGHFFVNICSWTKIVRLSIANCDSNLSNLYPLTIAL